MVSRALPAAHATNSTLDEIERELKAANDDGSLRKICSDLNRLREAQFTSAPLGVQARYSTLRGIMFSKAAISCGTGWLGYTPVQCLEHALEEFALTEAVLKRLRHRATGHRLSVELDTLQQVNSYEAGVATTQLNVRGIPLSKLPWEPSTGCLSREDQDRIAEALTWDYPLRSRF